MLISVSLKSNKNGYELWSQTCQARARSDQVDTFPLIPAQAGIQMECIDLAQSLLGPRFRGDERMVAADSILSDFALVAGIAEE